jgi:hypothetical protein
MPTPTSAPWDRVYSEAKVEIPALTDAVFKQALFRVLKDFTDKTNIWQETVPIAVTPNVLSYNFVVAHKGTPNRLMLLYDPAVADPDKKWVQSSVMMEVPGTIHISYAPSTAATWNAVVAKNPLPPVTGTGYPDIEAQDQWFIDKYRDALVFGVIGQCMMMPAKPFSNQKLGAYNRQNYIAERSKARADALHANVYNGQRWIFPQGWAAPKRGGWA